MEVEGEPKENLLVGGVKSKSDFPREMSYKEWIQLKNMAYKQIHKSAN